jgi:hypothetical protein
MSANFLDISGFFGGVDVHLFYPPVGPPVPNAHGVAQLHLIGRPWRVVPNVSTGHCPVLQNNWSMLMVPHYPLPLPQNPALEMAALALILVTSSSAPQMSAHSVTAGGEALLTAIFMAVGANSDCGIVPVPTNVDFNFNTVKTSPSAGDYASGVAGFLLNGLYNAATAFPNLGNPASIGIAIAQNFLDYAVVDPIAWLISKITGLVQTTVDP